MNIQTASSINGCAIRTSIFFVTLLFVLLIADNGRAERSDAASPLDSSDIVQSSHVRDYRAPSTLSAQFGGSLLTGDNHDQYDAGITFQASARVQAFSRFYLGVAYVRQTVNPRGSYWYADFAHYEPYPRLNYTQHEIYAIVGLNSGPRNARQMYFYVELGAGEMSHQEKTDFDTIRLASSKIALRLACGTVKPLSQKLGLSLEVSARRSGDKITDCHFIGSNRQGAMIGVSIGLVFMAGK